MNGILPIEIRLGDYPRQDKLVEVELDFDSMSPWFDLGARSDKNILRLVEVDPKHDQLVVDADVPFQFDYDEVRQTGWLIFLLNGLTPARTTRYFQLCIGDARPSSAKVPIVQLIDNVDYQEQKSYKIMTPKATYYYHKYGAGFASMIDQDGYDWLSFRPSGGSDGKYRGIPNLVYPEGFFHPGGTALTSHIISQGLLKLKLFSETKDQKWACTWEVYPTYARLTVLRVDHPYWFLYEGTPGGQLDEANDYIVRSDGVRTSAAERWDVRLSEPRWLYFGAGNANRVLYLIHHEVDGKTDSYWPMEENMTVFGFGRLNLESSLEKTPACFTIGFADGTHHADIADTINAVYQPMMIKVGKPVQQ